MTRFLPYVLERRAVEGGRVSWQEVATLSVRLQRLRSRPGLRRGSDTVIISHHLRVRFRDDIDVGMRFRHTSRVLIIHQIETVGRRSGWLSCLCEEQRLLHSAGVS